MPKKGGGYVKLCLKHKITIYKLYIFKSDDNGKQNTEESYTNKYLKNIACSYGYKFLCVDDKFSKLLKHTYVKMQFTILLVVWPKKVNIAVIKIS